jgi:hypothetical protein
MLSHHREPDANDALQDLVRTRLQRIRSLADDFLRLHWDRATGTAMVAQIAADAKAMAVMLREPVASKNGKGHTRKARG